MRTSSLSLAFLLCLTACGGSGSAASGGDNDGSASSSGSGSGSSGGSSGSGGGSGSSSGGSSGSGSGGGSGSSSGGRDGGMDAGVDAGPLVGASVLMMHNHINRDGLFIDPLITPTTAPTFARDTSFAGTISGNVYATPLYVENGPGGKGTFYQATENGTVYALDETTGAVVWSKNVGAPAKSTGAGCGNISPIGITGTPAIDLDTRLIVFASAVDTADAGVISTHMIYGLSIDTGTVVWSVDVSKLKDPTGLAFTPQTQNQRAAVLIVNGVAYVAYGGHYGDCGTYHGWVVGVPLSGTGAKAWATQVPGAAIWGSGGPASDGQSIYVTTGNGFDTGASYAESEGLFRLDPGPTFTTATDDYFAPYNWATLDANDLDLSGSGPMIIDAPSITPSTLVMAAGKDGFVYLLNRMNLGGIATEAQQANVGKIQASNGNLSNAGAWATIGGTTYAVVRPNGENAGVGCPTGTSGDLVAIKLDPTAPEKMTVAWCAASLGVGSPSITSPDGTTSALVWVFAADPGSRAQLYAWDLATGAPVYTGGSATTDTAKNVRRFTAPIAVHGRVFVAGDNQVYAYKAK